MGHKAVLAKTVQDHHVRGLQINFPSYAWWHLVVLDVHIQDLVWARLLRVEMADFTLGARRRSPDSGRPRMMSEASHLPDPVLGVQLAPGRGRSARDWFRGTPVTGEEWSARGKTGSACRLCRRRVVSTTSQRRRRRLCKT